MDVLMVENTNFVLSKNENKLNHSDFIERKDWYKSKDLKIFFGIYEKILDVKTLNMKIKRNQLELSYKRKTQCHRGRETL